MLLLKHAAFICVISLVIKWLEELILN